MRSDVTDEQDPSLRQKCVQRDPINQNTRQEHSREKERFDRCLVIVFQSNPINREAQKEKRDNSHTVESGALPGGFGDYGDHGDGLLLLLRDSREKVGKGTAFEIDCCIRTILLSMFRK